VPQNEGAWGGRTGDVGRRGKFQSKKKGSREREKELEGEKERGGALGQNQVTKVLLQPAAGVTKKERRQSHRSEREGGPLKEGNHRN